MITLACSCGRRFQTKDENAGKSTKCPVCGSALVVPTPGVDEGPLASPNKPTPPAWWYPKGQPEIPKDASPPAPMTGETRTKVTAPPRVAESPEPEIPPVPEKKSRRLVIASSIGGAALLLLGLIVWMASPGSTSGPALKNDPIAKNSGPSTSSANSKTERPPGENLGSVDKPSTLRPEDKPKATSNTPTTASGSAETDQPRLKLLVPAYYYPAGPGLKQWEQLIEAATRVPVVAIVNPSSGPGDQPNSDYSAIVSRAVRRGVNVVGYVNTFYARRPLAEVRADVDRWVRFYPDITGIFFDAQASEPGQADYYVSLRDYATKKIKKATVITNPGTLCAEEYATRLTSVTLCLFTAPAGFEDLRLPRWAERHPSGHFAAMPNHIASPEQMRDCIQLASTRGFGLIYVTDAKGPNPWDRLPTYWDAEVEAVRKVNSGQAP